MSEPTFTHTLTKEGEQPINATLQDGKLVGAPEGVLSPDATSYTVSDTNDVWAVSEYVATAPEEEPAAPVEGAVVGGRRQRSSQKKGSRKSKKCSGGKKSKKQQKGGKRKSQKSSKRGGKKQQKPLTPSAMSEQ